MPSNNVNPNNLIRIVKENNKILKEMLKWNKAHFKTSKNAAFLKKTQAAINRSR